MRKQLILWVSILILILPSCIDDNKGFEEFYNSMGNNPALTIPWMQNIVKDLRKTQARIEAYQYDGELYYTIQSYEMDGDIEISPYTIYESNEKKAIVYFHADNIRDTETKKDSVYLKFQDDAIYEYLIWKNMPKNGSEIDF